MDDLDKLISQAQYGRGLWIGLFPDAAPFALDLGGEWPKCADAHCTMLHLGKGVPLKVASALKVVELIGQYHAMLETRIDGVGRFGGNKADGDPIVLLLSSPRVRQLRDHVRQSLLDHGQMVDASYWDYKPHITLGRVPRDSPYWILHPPSDLTIDLTHVGVVCGEHRVYFPLRGK